MKKLKYKAKSIEPLKINTGNLYYSLLPLDALYNHNLPRLKDSQFQSALIKITRDINLLLYMNDQQFWKELTENQTVLVSLESCITVFARRCFGRFEVGTLVKTETMLDKDDYFRMYSLLMENVLLVYYRVSEAPFGEAGKIVYDNWLLDVPKLLDLAAVYGGSNPDIMKKLIENAFKANENYDQDILDFFSSVENHWVLRPKQQRITQIDFSPSSLNRKNYGNRKKFMLEEATREIFQLKDILFNLINFLHFFPKEYAYEFACDYKIQERLLKGLAIFLKQTSEDWKLQDYASYFQLHFEDIRQTIASYLIVLFGLLREILQGNRKQCENFVDLAENTYQTFCLCFSERETESQSIYYQRMVHHLFEETEEPVFFMSANQIKNSDERTHRSIENCVKYESNYRKHKRLGASQNSYDQAYDDFIRSISKYKQTTASKDSSQVQNLERERQAQRQRRDMPANFYLSMYDLKYKTISLEYYDDLEQQDEFRRIQHQEPSKNINTSFITPQKKRYQPKKGTYDNRDQQLSVWDLNQLEQTKIQQRSFVLGQAASCLASQNLQSIDISLIAQGQQASVVQHMGEKTINLSVFEGEKEKNNFNDLSFSCIVAANNQKQHSSVVRVVDDEDDKNDIEDIIANIQITTSIQMEPSSEVQGGKKPKDAEDEPEYSKFFWNKQQLSFDIYDY